MAINLAKQESRGDATVSVTPEGASMYSTQAKPETDIPYVAQRFADLWNREGRCTCRRAVELYSTCPQSNGSDKDSYAHLVRDVAQWSEQCGCRGILVYTDNSLVDPWLVAQIIVETTRELCPLVAIQPMYMHPYAAAKMVSSFAYLHHRPICLNMVAGGFKNDLAALNDTTPHDKRYGRLLEYTSIIKQLLASPAPVTLEGEFYKVDKLRMTPPLPSELIPEIFVSGSSDAGLEAARALGATAVKYPRPASECAGEPPVNGYKSGIRAGIIARESEDEAWEIAEQRFPEDRKGELTHQMAMKVSDSLWHKQLSETAEQTRATRSVYWLRPFESYKTFCPYLVGSYQAVACELGRYIALGYRTFILDIPTSREDLQHTRAVFDRAAELAGLHA
jgi:alkanesulfonate monooxygenase